ncbi:MAG: hypothetical protein WBO23_18615 [Burkholderiales bacterium]
MATISRKRATEGGDLEALEALRRDIRDALVRTKMEIDGEIRRYPTPIPRCDAQFNHLHEQRSRLARELDRIGPLTRERPARSDCLATIERFVASAPYTDEPAERELRSRVKARLLALADRVRV